MVFKILIIDDEEIWQKKLTHVLAELGCEVICCGNAAEAKRFLQTQKFHLIVLDLCLDGDSYTCASDEFVTWILKKYPYIPKLITSGKEIEKEIMFEMGKHAQGGGLDFIEKGTFDLAEFRKKTRHLLQRYDLIRILHLSDIHLGNFEDALKYKVQLKTDLIKNFKVNQIDFLVISGDIANHALESEYSAALELIAGIANRFAIEPSHVIVVPGNHDVNWDDSEAAYKYVKNGKIPADLEKGSSISAGEEGVLIRDERLYKERFSNFNLAFYQRLFARPYPLEYGEQGMIQEFPDIKLLFMGLNSSWQIDHHFSKRAEINQPALDIALDQVMDQKYDSWVKIAVWHHPISGLQMMPDDFMELLAKNGFQICLHGHIHAAREGFYKYDDLSGVHIIGAGTFGAPADELTTGIPYQYNLLILDQATGSVKVETRKKEKANGAWSADARWGDKNDPKPFYSFSLRADEPEGKPIVQTEV